MPDNLADSKSWCFYEGVSLLANQLSKGLLAGQVFPLCLYLSRVPIQYETVSRRVWAWVSRKPDRKRDRTAGGFHTVLVVHPAFLSSQPGP